MPEKTNDQKFIFKLTKILRDGSIVFMMAGLVIFVSAKYNFYYLLIIMSALVLFTFYFLRDPKRKLTVDKKGVVATADGKVIFAGKSEEKHFLGGECNKVVIFMNLFNVHRNRAPIEGVIKFYRYNRGKFRPAMKIENMDTNEHNLIGIEGKNCKIVVSQIAGLIAQRVIFYKNQGELVRQSDEIGIIRYGSANAIYFPLDYEICVKPGDKVKAGIHVVGRKK